MLILSQAVDSLCQFPLKAAAVVTDIVAEISSQSQLPPAGSLVAISTALGSKVNCRLICIRKAADPDDDMMMMLMMMMMMMMIMMMRK